jgi:hypothetical protein
MLAQTHSQLEGHFRKLSRERVPLGYPVYAFEHGLESQEINTVRQALCADLVRTGRVKREYWLLWAVVAAEIGYTYDGDEYWHSFKSEVPAWFTHSNREAVREWFVDFARRFNGFQPTGRWADHFSIIAWPITHSILPRYLQSPFAHHLYDLRHDLAANENANIEQLGQLLGDRYYGTSSRFENFLQQTALTARLVLALRDEDEQGSVTPIYRPTLARIVRDLEQKGSSRGYLRDARRVLRDARLRARSGLVDQMQSASSGTPSPEMAQTVPPGIKLTARRTQNDTWTICMALPNFAALMAQTGVTAATLDKMRLRFVDRPDSWMPGRALLSYSDSNHPLLALPNPLSDSVIQSREPAEPAKALTSQLRILSRSPWLLRVHEDGVARQVLGNHVRTAEDYIIATSSTVAPDILSALSLHEIVCATAGVLLYQMRTPDVASPQFIQGLSKLSFGYALQAQVKPFGLVPRWDEANACSAWLPNEEILLHLSADFHVAEFTVTIDGHEKTRVAVSEKNDVLVSLGTPPLGRYAVEIAATAVNAGSNGKGLRPISPETIFIEVRSPIPWRHGVKMQTGLRVVLEPSDATFDDLLEKRASLSVHGPADRTATVEARLYNMSGNVFDTTEIGRLELPTKDALMARVIERLAHDPLLSEKIQSALRVELAFVVDELGAATFSFPHNVPPLRWKLAHIEAQYIMRLVDEAGVAANTSVSRYDMTIPDERKAVSPEDCVLGVPVDPPGSLFVASYEGRFYAAFASVPPRGRLTAFSDLAAKISLSAPGDSSRNIMRLLAILRLWRRSQPLGAVAAFRKAKVLGAIEGQIERLACGARWVDKAQRYRSDNASRLEDLQGEVGGSPGFASRMRTTDWTWHSDNARAKAEFFRLAKTYEVCEDKAICDLALRLAFNPASIRLTDPKQGALNFEQLGTKGNLARGAYFAKLTSDLRFRQSHEGKGAPQ